MGAEPACLPSTELYYDDGTATGYVSTTCPSCSDVQGVRFSVPAGLPSATISSVRFWCQPASPGASVEVWLLGADRKTDLVPHITCAVGSTGWQTATPPENAVSGDFFVFVRRLEKGTSLGYDYWNDAHRSFAGEHPAVATEWGRPGEGGDIMIRATVEASVHVGQGQMYSTIQAAIDAACAGLTIHVHPGTYTENVTVSKAVTIASTGGPSQTTVQSPSGRRSTFTVTAPGVSLSGLTIRGATDTDRAGVSISGASACVISGNIITNNNLGVYLSEGSAQNIVVENEFRSNSNAVYVDGSAELHHGQQDTWEHRGAGLGRLPLRLGVGHPAALQQHYARSRHGRRTSRLQPECGGGRPRHRELVGRCRRPRERGRSGAIRGRRHSLRAVAGRGSIASEDRRGRRG